MNIVGSRLLTDSLNWSWARQRHLFGFCVNVRLRERSSGTSSVAPVVSAKADGPHVNLLRLLTVSVCVLGHVVRPQGPVVATGEICNRFKHVRLSNLHLTADTAIATWSAVVSLFSSWAAPFISSLLAFPFVDLRPAERFISLLRELGHRTAMGAFPAEKATDFKKRIPAGG